jgi:hypothetical protein
MPPWAVAPLLPWLVGGRFQSDLVDSHTGTLPLCVPRTRAGMVPFLGTLGGRDRRFGRRVVRHLLETPSSLLP